ncbi:MAG: macro domain-containing protein [Lewinellaceae bacterium]|nr:macro domain-containing protein [Lewinellaceae bacterium]
MEYITGNLLESSTQALVNTVNTVGVMGKGIALQFKEQFPTNFKVYAGACKRGEMKIGKMLVVKELTLEGEKIIVNFPTKAEWFKKSQYSYIEEGLKDLVNVIQEYKIKSISLPPLGCGNGGLKWEKVKGLIDQYLSPLQNIQIIVFEPNDAVKKILQNENHRKEVELKPGRAMLLYALYQYAKHGEPASVFAANKLAYFLQQSGEPLKLQFVPYYYGPYSNVVEKVLYALNGKYLKGMEQMQTSPFESLNLNWERYDEVEGYIKKNLNADQLHRLTSLFEFIKGFESTLSLEVLASVHFLTTKNPGIKEDELLQGIQSWSDRKKNIIKLDHIRIAHQHLQEYGSRLDFN